MPLYQCEECGCIENTACGHYWRRHKVEGYIWDGIEDRKGKKLCSVCGPLLYHSGKATGFGVWHNRFKRDFLPLGMFIENDRGGLTHKENGDDRYMNYVIMPLVLG